MSTTKSTDPLAGIPANLHAEIQNIWASEVAGGRAAFEATGSYVGVTGQWKVSRLLRNNGIGPGRDGRWKAVRDHGRRPYFGEIAP